MCKPLTDFGEVRPAKRPRIDSPEETTEQQEREEGDPLSEPKASIVWSCLGFTLHKVPKPFQKTVNQTVSFDIPPEAPNKGKCRPVVLVKCCDDLMTSFEKLHKSCLGLTVATVRNEVIALVVKHYNARLEVPGGYSVHKPSDEKKLSGTTVSNLWDCLSSTSHVSNIVGKGKVINKSECPTFEEAVVLLEEDGITSGSWNAAHGNMLRAAQIGLTLTRTQLAIQIMGTDLKEYLKDKAECDAMIYKMSTDGPHFLDDFKKASVINMKGRPWNPHPRRIDEVKLKDILWGSGPYSGAHRERTLCFVGQEGKGKSISFMDWRGKCAEGPIRSSTHMAGPSTITDF